MSANNFLRVDFDSEYVVEDCDAENGHRMFVVGRSITLSGAIKIANDYMKENVVEYGLSITEKATK